MDYYIEFSKIAKKSSDQIYSLLLIVYLSIIEKGVISRNQPVLHLQTFLVIKANGMVLEPTSIEHEKFPFHEIIDSIITKNIQILKPAVMF